MSRHRHFCFTHNNYENTYQEDNIECRYIAYSKEVSASGTPHLQGFVSFVSAKTKKAAIKVLTGCHVEVMLGSYDENTAYCSKAGELIERGEKPMSNDNKGRAEKLRWVKILANAKAGNFDEIDADVQVRYYGTLKRIAMDHMVKPAPMADVCGLWIHGESGVGKSRYVWETWPDHYIKSRNKWWSGYIDQPVVCLDDLGPEDAKWMGSFLKDWADYKPFQGETKGGGIQIRPVKFIVTSQYTIEDLWFDIETRDALNRRFEKKLLLKPENPGWHLCCGNKV